jgi:hypothetical protein
MAWLWLNIGIGAPIFLAIAGIPLWIVIRYPDTGPAFETYSVQGGRAPTVRGPGSPSRPAGHARPLSLRDRRA